MGTLQKIRQSWGSAVIWLHQQWAGSPWWRHQSWNLGNPSSGRQLVQWQWVINASGRYRAVGHQCFITMMSHWLHHIESKIQHHTTSAKFSTLLPTQSLAWASLTPPCVSMGSCSYWLAQQITQVAIYTPTYIQISNIQSTHRVCTQYRFSNHTLESHLDHTASTRLLAYFVNIQGEAYLLNKSGAAPMGIRRNQTKSQLCLACSMMNAPTKFEVSLVSSLARNVENIQLPRSQETMGIQCLESPIINVATFEVNLMSRNVQEPQKWDRWMHRQMHEQKDIAMCPSVC